MGEWSNLTQREKSNIIRFAIKNGVSDINTIRDTFNVYVSGNGGENEYKEGEGSRNPLIGKKYYKDGNTDAYLMQRKF